MDTEAPTTVMTIRRYWDADAATYDRAPGHHPGSAAERAAWAAALHQLLPPAPAAVLDMGAGTGFLSLILARLGYQVTAADLSPGMLGQLRAKAAAARPPVEVVETAADAPPAGPFDAVVERHLVWTLPDPCRALSAWRRVAPGGRLVLLESLWGDAADVPERLRVRGRRALHRLRREPPAHHDEYDPTLQAGLPLGTGTPPGKLVELTEAAGWSAERLRRLRDVEWAALSGLPPMDRLLGVSPRFAVAADDR